MSIWKNNNPIDLWSLVHLLSGFLLGGLFYWLDTKFWHALLLTLFLVLLWEVFEYAVKIIEPPLNVAGDILIGTLGFLLACYLYTGKGLFDPGIYLTLAGSTLILAVWGFLDFMKRGSR